MFKPARRWSVQPQTQTQAQNSNPNSNPNLSEGKILNSELKTVVQISYNLYRRGWLRAF